MDCEVAHRIYFLNADLISPKIKDPLRCNTVLYLNWLDYIYIMQYVISVKQLCFSFGKKKVEIFKVIITVCMFFQ